MADWHQFTGHLPITMAAYELTKKQGFNEKNPGTETALLQMTLHKPTENSRGIRFGAQVPWRSPAIRLSVSAVLSGLVGGVNRQATCSKVDARGVSNQIANFGRPPGLHGEAPFSLTLIHPCGRKHRPSKSTHEPSHAA